METQPFSSGRVTGLGAILVPGQDFGSREFGDGLEDLDDCRVKPVDVEWLARDDAQPRHLLQDRRVGGRGRVVLHQEGQPIEEGGGIKVVDLDAHGGFHVNGGSTWPGCGA